MKLIKITITLTAAILILTIGLLFFVNPQWNKYVYRFQAEAFGNEAGFLDPPKNYTGVWKNWGIGRILLSEATYRNGKLEGIYFSYRIDGSLEYVTRYKSNGTNFSPHGIIIHYHENGEMKMQGGIVKGFDKKGLWFSYNENGDLAEINTYKVKSKSWRHVIDTIVYNKKDGIDLRDQYTQEIKEFDNEVSNFKKEHGLK